MSSSKSTAQATKPSLNITNIDEPSEQERYEMIAEAAYYNAELRNFRDGDPELDWYMAEEQIEHQLLNRVD